MKAQVEKFGNALIRRIVELWLDFESTAHGCKHGLGIFGVHCINRLEPSTSVVNGFAWCSAYSSPHDYYLRIFDIRIFDMLRKLKENVTCRGGFGISIGRPERIGELEYTAIMLEGANA